VRGVIGGPVVEPSIRALAFGAASGPVARPWECRSRYRGDRLAWQVGGVLPFPSPPTCGGGQHGVAVWGAGGSGPGSVGPVARSGVTGWNWPPPFSARAGGEARCEAIGGPVVEPSIRVRRGQGGVGTRRGDPREIGRDILAAGWHGRSGVSPLFLLPPHEGRSAQGGFLGTGRVWSGFGWHGRSGVSPLFLLPPHAERSAWVGCLRSGREWSGFGRTSRTVGCNGVDLAAPHPPSLPSRRRERAVRSGGFGVPVLESCLGVLEFRGGVGASYPTVTGLVGISRGPMDMAGRGAPRCPCSSTSGDVPAA
jgi:hypothetical protein